MKRHHNSNGLSPAGRLMAALVVGIVVWFSGHVWTGAQGGCEQRAGDGVAGPIYERAVDR